MLRRLASVTFGLACSIAIHGQASFPVSPKSPRAPAIDRVLARTDANKDGWIGEQDYEALNAWIQQNKTTLPWPQGTRDRFRSTQLLELKIIASNRALASVNNTALRLRVEMGGVAKNGQRLSLLGHAEAVFDKSPAGWQLKTFRLEPLRENANAAPRFRDISQSALGHHTSYKHQLARGLDAWRTELDAATAPA